MVKYIVDRMVVADSRFNEILKLMNGGHSDVIIVEEIAHESRGDNRFESIKKYFVDHVCDEYVDILKNRVVNDMIDSGALLPNEGSGETMMAVEYFYEGKGEQANLFDLVGGDEETKVIVTEDKKAKAYFGDNNISFIDSKTFFDRTLGETT